MANVLARPLQDWLDDLRASASGIAAGSSAALTTATAATLAGMAAGRSADEWSEAAGAAAQADALAARAAGLADEVAHAYREARGALEKRQALPADTRDDTLGAALGRAAEVPLQIAQVAADVAVLSEQVADHGLDDARPDAVAAGLLAAGAAGAAAHLVYVNLTTSPEDDLVQRARRAAETAQDRARRTAEATP